MEWRLASSVVTVALVVMGAPGVAAAGPQFSAPAFRAMPDSTLGSGSIVTADFNRDGHEDVAAIGLDTGTVSVLLGKGDGNFDRRIDSRAPEASLGGVTRAAVGDVDADGRPDVATTNWGADGPISLWLNDGDGHFQRDAVYLAGRSVDDITLADVNRDGITDVIALDEGQRRLIVLLGRRRPPTRCARPRGADRRPPSRHTRRRFSRGA